MIGRPVRRRIPWAGGRSIAALRWWNGFLFLALCGAVSAQTTTVQLETVRTSVQPQLDVVVPTGEIRQDTVVPVGAGRFDVRSRFNLYSGSMDGRVRVSRPLGPIVPFFAVGLTVDTEPVFVTEVDGALPGDAGPQTVERDRYGSVGLRWNALPGTIGLSSELRERLFLTGAGDDAESVDITNTLAWTVEDVQPILPQQTPETVGGFLRVSLAQRNSLDTGRAIDITGRIEGRLNHRPWDRWSLEHRLTISSPVVVWDRNRSRPVGLGGFDSVRGLDSGAVTARRVVVVGNTLSRALGARGDEVDMSIRDIRLHSLRAVAILDGAIYQEEYALARRPAAVASAGIGMATTVTAPGGIHLDLRSYVAVPVTQVPIPVVYFRTSLFSLATD